MVLNVSYDLHQPGRDYTRVHQYIVGRAGASNVAHPQGSLWLVDTVDSTTSWRDGLNDVTDTNDEILVVRMSHDWASRYMDNAVASWLKSPTRRW